MKSLYTSLLALVGLTSLSAQDCGITININPTVELCAPGSTVLLPIITGDFSTFAWSPTTGLTDPTALITTANVTDSVTYTLNVLSLSGNNLITNGDFSMGDTGFTSDYIYGTGGGVGLLSNEGEYAIADNAGDTHNQFANCSDHTGGGNMMVINASGDASNLWCQVITVEANTDYFFSAWVTSVTSENPAQLQFSVNGVQLGTSFNASPSTCNWQQFSSEWSSDATTTAEICIVNTNFTPAGNDFALDDISFEAFCTTTATVDVNVTELDADLNVPNEVCGLAESVMPEEYFTANTSTGGTWTLDGQAITSFIPADLSPGTHVLEYEVSTGACSNSSQAVFTIAEPPNAGTPDFFTECFDPGTTFQANLFSVLTDPDPNGSWEYLNGPNTATINTSTGQVMATEAGSYQFMYIADGGSACPNDTTIQLFDLALNPVADLPATASLDCVVEQATLTSSNISTGNNILYNWYQDGLLLEDVFINSLEVTEAGTYELIVIDENTNCQSSATTIVDDIRDDVSFELITAPAPCDNPLAGTIAITNITGGTPPYLASLDGATYVPTESFTNLTPGDYTVFIQDAGGCEAQLDASLPAPTNPTLMLEVSEEEPISLGSTLTLSVISNPPVELLDTVIWTPGIPDSLQISEKQWLIQPTETTNYSLLVRDANGCEAEASILITVRPEGKVFIPNVISPNEDGSNDRFVIFDAGSIANIPYMRVFDRWGGLVYEATNLAANSSDRAWDGRKGGQLMPAGVYIYAAEVEWLNGTTSIIQGEISIVY
ncbi:MAG: gliding motility-associated C-terminal domain-containing protein [Bacteroidota bacterium]